MEEKKDLAPIIVFCYDRIDVLKTTIATLSTNTYADQSDLYVFCDGPRNESNKLKTDEVRLFVKGIQGFRQLNIIESEVNKGLAPSVISGVSKVLETHDKVIVIEDDLILSTNFLAWMNETLEKYKDNEQVFSISGFCPHVQELGDNYPYDGFFTQKAHSWGWATWRNRWEKVDWEVKDWNVFSQSKHLQKAFNSIGSEMSGLLFDQMSGRKSSWWVRFSYTQFKLGKMTLYPVLSKVINDGFTNEATHCNVYNRYRVDFDQTGKTGFELPKDTVCDEKLNKRFFYYYSVRARIIGKIKTWLMKMGLISQYSIKP